MGLTGSEPSEIGIVITGMEETIHQSARIPADLQTTLSHLLGPEGDRIFESFYLKEQPMCRPGNRRTHHYESCAETGFSRDPGLADRDLSIPGSLARSPQKTLRLRQGHCADVDHHGVRLMVVPRG